MIWAGFGPIGNNEKKVRTDYEQVLGDVLFTFYGANFFFENVIASSPKSCIILIWEFFFKFIWPPKTWKKRSQIGLNSQTTVYYPIVDISLRNFYKITSIASMYIHNQLNNLKSLKMTVKEQFGAILSQNLCQSVLK